MEKRPSILATNLMKKVKTILRLKENYLKTCVPDRTVIYGAYATGHMFFKISINCQMYY